MTFTQWLEAKSNWVEIDSLPPDVIEDIVSNLIDHVPALNGETAEFVRDNLVGLVSPIKLQLKSVPTQSLYRQFGKRRVSKLAVNKLSTLMTGGVSLHPVLVDGDRFVDGGHRVAAHMQNNIELISVVDIGPLLHMDWEKWLAGS